MPGPTDDENALLGFLGGEDLEGLKGLGTDLNDLNDRELDVGEKANDAQDFEDISDDDLADDDDDVEVKAQSKQDGAVEPDDVDEDDEFDDLFGDGADSPEAKAEDSTSEAALAADETIDNLPTADEESEEEDAETREQRLLFEQAARARELRTGADGGLPPPPPTDDELFYTIWPQFEAGKPPRFGELLPQKKAYYPGKQPLKPPKPIHPSRVNLELEQDQEKAFRLPVAGKLPFELREDEARGRGVVLLAEPRAQEAGSDDEDTVGLLEEDEGVGGVTWQDIVALCDDWNVASGDVVSDDEDEVPIVEKDSHVDDLFLDDDFDTLENPRPVKRRRVGDAGTEPLQVLHKLNTIFEEPEKATARLAKGINLDLNDPYLLVDVKDRSTALPQKRMLGAGTKRDVAGGLTKSLSARYNISNDHEYELLKQNHQNKIRAQVGNTPLEHATPAIRLQYPYYKQDLDVRERRRWHRPIFHVTPGDVWFKKPASHKRKLMRVKEPSELYITTTDLTVGDNSSIALLEYSEENPAMLSSFGMGNRLINYYRRKDIEDTARPKLDIGETAILLPQDKSPFDRFGDVDRGQIVPTLSNSMYRAPVFKHEAKPYDFLISKSSTGLGGPSYVLRNVENLHVVGQEFPFVAVPGPKARAATNVNKFRLHMVSYRMYNKRQGKLTMDDVKRHNPETDLPTIRTKMKDFMEFDKTAGQGKGVWRAKREPPAEAEIRSMVKPEDVIALYAMQVGQQHLSDSGYHRRGDDDMEDDDDDDGDAGAGNLDRQLTPWNTTKNFLASCKGGAMLEVHGEGDPSGRGEALSMIKTSMKGGFKAIGQSIEDRLNTQKQKELGGHKYNVARQSQEYAEAIRRVWDAQARALSSTELHEDTDMGGVEDAMPNIRAGTPGSGAPRGRRDDDSASMFSIGSGLEQSGKVLRITRRYVDKYGKEDIFPEVVRDPRVIRAYQKRRRELDLGRLTLDQINPTGDPEEDAARKRMLQAEYDRLARNMDRRDGRQKSRNANAGSPTSPDPLDPDADDGYLQSAPKGAAKRQKYTSGTTGRKCANCGQIGHIKTNKKLCPMLNGTASPGASGGQSAFGAIGGPQNTQEMGAPASQVNGGGGSFE